jgi:hypothetical protein
VLPAVHLLAVLRPAHPLDDLVERQVEGDVLVGPRRLGADEGPRADQGELDPVVAGGAVLLVVAADLDLEGECLRGEVGAFSAFSVA